MTDDLFDDFDLKSSAPQTEEEAVLEEDFASGNFDTEETGNTSENLHPDIFDEEENEIPEEEEIVLSEDEIRNLNEKINTVEEKSFAFSDEKKAPFKSSEENFRRAADETVVEIRTIDKIRRSDVRIDPDNFGDTLRRLREAACVSTAELAEELRIKETFISALEREDYESLPPVVFIIAYIRKLGGVYRLNEEEIKALTANVRKRMEIEIPEDINKVVSIYEPSEENENKVRHIITFFIVIAVIAVLLIGTGIFFFVSRPGSSEKDIRLPQGKNVEQFSADTVIKLQPQVKLQPRPLKINK